MKTKYAKQIKAIVVGVNYKNIDEVPPFMRIQCGILKNWQDSKEPLKILHEDKQILFGYLVHTFDVSDRLGNILTVSAENIKIIN